MKNHWAQTFLMYAKATGIEATPLNYQNGWLETAVIGASRCFMKSMTFGVGRREYFQGVDPGKLNDSGDAVVLCGGQNGHLRDIFVIPWKSFFRALSKSEPVNSYKDREYLQYKLHVHDRGGAWEIRFQGGGAPVLPVSSWRHDSAGAVAALQGR